MEEMDVVGTIDWLEIGFLILVGSMVALAGIFSLYVLVGLFRNTGLRRKGPA